MKESASSRASVRQGFEIVVQQDHRAVAFIRPSKSEGRMISEVIADLKRRGSNAMIDDDLAHDIEEGIKAHGQPWNPPSWD